MISGWKLKLIHGIHISITFEAISRSDALYDGYAGGTLIGRVEHWSACKQPLRGDGNENAPLTMSFVIK